MAGRHIQCVLLIAIAFSALHYSTESEVQIEPPDSSLSITYSSARPSLVPHESCVPFLHNVTYSSDDGECKYNLTVQSCKGQCVSETIPKFYANRLFVPVSSSVDMNYKTECKCCGIQSWVDAGSRKLPLLCRNGSTITTSERIVFALTCACRDCSKV